MSGFHCVCGACLEVGEQVRREGVWTMGGVACEYRTCLRCFSTRAWAPEDVVAGRRVAIYRDADTSEVDWEGDRFLDALEQEPSGGAEVRRNGILLASGVAAPNGRSFWRVCAPHAQDG